MASEGMIKNRGCWLQSQTAPGSTSATRHEGRSPYGHLFPSREADWMGIDTLFVVLADRRWIVDAQDELARTGAR